MPKVPSNIESLSEKLEEISKRLALEKPSNISPSRIRAVRKRLAQAYDELRVVIEELDPIKHPGFIFDPSNPNVVGRIVGITMIAQPRKPLGAVERFYGSGVYALYYRGDFAPYRKISGSEHPIYVGKADPEDPNSKTAKQQGSPLAGRLAEHARTIAKTEPTLRLTDFEYRALVVQTGWQTPAEDYLIGLFMPIWNKEVRICYGFGKHGDAPKTRANRRSPWDTLHFGRDWAHRDPNMKDARPRPQIIEDIQDHFVQHPPLQSVDEILRIFLDEIRALT